ncbi:hypothetical protein BTA51_12080 [Hahella sp. CCB-MM4]|uniref:substrate-binding periplasmic protein n=1 Tax=Hahella sp. (strain CCB-MM4) TaxID=1926491 RepID=UPI000B9A22F2|nr:transporter substrate-binding domain-containing protein [Hahella sp. CCB-MM4]OZG73212.1 hypothetical protein BTA51_12080 [Hahella sp. CCB-MM4]
MKAKVRNFRLWALGVVAILSVIPSASRALDNLPNINICGDGAEWPPYHYFQRDDGKVTSNIVGYDVDVLRAILEPEGYTLTFFLPPWKRCMFEVSKGEQFQIAMSSSFNNSRDLIFHLSLPYYETTPHYFYSKMQYPNGLRVDKVTDLYNYKGCGLLGYNYAGFGITNELINTSANNFEQVIKMTHRGRCDYFLARFEIFMGFRWIGQNFPMDPDLSHSKVPGNSGDPFHFLISRNHPQSARLVELVNNGITRLKGNGQLSELLNKYFKDL